MLEPDSVSLRSDILRAGNGRFCDHLRACFFRHFSASLCRIVARRKNALVIIIKGTHRLAHRAQLLLVLLVKVAVTALVQTIVSCFVDSGTTDGLFVEIKSSFSQRGIFLIISFYSTLWVATLESETILDRK